MRKLLLFVFISSSILIKAQTIDTNYVNKICSDLSILDTTVNNVRWIVKYNTVIPDYKKHSGILSLEVITLINNVPFTFQNRPITSVTLSREEFFRINTFPLLCPENINMIKQKAIKLYIKK